MKQQLAVMRSRSGAFWFVLACFILLSLMTLAACGNSNTTSGSQQTTKSSTSTNTNTNASTTVTTTSQSTNHVSLAELIGQPSAKITQGANFKVTGLVKNMDKLQHDIYLQATLKDASGKIVGIARGLADNVQGGQTATFTIQGITKVPTWSSVSVVITKVSENVNGQISVPSSGS